MRIDNFSYIHEAVCIEYETIWNNVKENLSFVWKV